MSPDHLPAGRARAGDDPSFVGRGLRFPLAIDASGSLAFADAGESTDSAIRVVLSTAPGERVMRPAFGCRIWDLLFEPVNANTVGLMAEAVRQAIAQWEPRVEVEDVAVVPDDDDQALVRIHIAYRMRATNDRRNLVYPFYVIPREAAHGERAASDREEA
ncbi:MAG TPA: GPW/gp25 family protein [Acidimicrobiales bacterium]|nr:GPW/gp25 family protein [Acidimicrobiales bacterium]